MILFYLVMHCQAYSRVYKTYKIIEEQFTK